MNKFFSKLGYGCLLMSVMTLSSARAATNTWDGDASVDWTNALNWVGDSGPSTADYILFDNVSFGFAIPVTMAVAIDE